MTYIDQSLRGHNYLISNQFTVADGYLFTVLRRAKTIGLNLETFTELTAYFNRLQARPAVQKALLAET